MPESQHTEWKANWRDAYLAKVCGCANAQGSSLVIGRNDQGLAVTNAFFRAGEIEAWGWGIERIFAAYREEHALEPGLKRHSHGIWLEFPYDPADLWMVKKGIAKATEQVTPEIKRVLEVLKDEAMPPFNIQLRLGLKHCPTFRANYLFPALEADLIEMTLTDKPNSCLTSAGRRTLQLIKSASQHEH